MRMTYIVAVTPDHDSGLAVIIPNGVGVLDLIFLRLVRKENKCRCKLLSSKEDRKTYFCLHL